MLRYYCVCICIFLAVNCRAHTVITLHPDSSCGIDATIFSFWPDTNSGSNPDFIATAWTFQGNPSTTRALVSFDLATIPSGASVSSAVLELFHYPSPNNTGHSNLSAPATCWIERITQPWTEFGVTWNNQPTTTGLNQVFVPAPTSMTQNYSIIVTTLVQDMLNDPTNSFGFMLRQQNESYYRSLLFASSDMSNPLLHPKLTIIYSLDIPPTAGCWTNFVISPAAPPPSGPDPVVIMPNVFTPNGDGINDTFYADSVYYRVDEFLIYDRWGILVYSAKPGKAWDGRTTSGTSCVDGTYYYVFRYSWGSEGRAVTGFVTLLH